MDEQKLIEGCIKGNARAQKELFDHFAGEMFGVCLYYSSTRADAEDTLHEGFLKVFRNIHTFKGEGSLKGWIRRIIINTALEKFRKKNPVFLSDNQHFDPPDIPDRDEIFSNIHAEELITIIQELTPQYRMVFNLYALEGLSHKEIAEKLGISEGTSKSNLARARTILQQKVKQRFGITLNKLNV